MLSQFYTFPSWDNLLYFYNYNIIYLFVDYLLAISLQISCCEYRLFYIHYFCKNNNVFQFKMIFNWLPLLNCQLTWGSTFFIESGFKRNYFSFPMLVFFFIWTKVIVTISKSVITIIITIIAVAGVAVFHNFIWSWYSWWSLSSGLLKLIHNCQMMVCWVFLPIIWIRSVWYL